MKLQILVDLDDVLCDWCQSVCNTFSIDLNNQEIRSHIENNWGGQCKYIPEEEMWAVINKIGASWWENLPLLPWANELYSELSKIGEVCLLTAPNNHYSCIEGKVKWIKHHFDTRNFLIGKPKHFCAKANSVLIDDKPDNCAKFIENGGNAFQWPSSLKIIRMGISQTTVLECLNFVRGIEY